MRAITVDDFGAPAVLSEQPTPHPGSSEVLVRVHAASVNGFDVSVAAGMLKGMMEHRFPVVLGKDFAGTVAAVGDGGARFAVGQRVFGVVTKPVLGEGSFGEYVVVDAQTGITALPAGLDLASAGALGLAGTAARDGVAALAPVPGDLVLVSGATGGVGALAVQLLSAAGATVIATARPGIEADFVRGLGAGHTVDHTADLEEQVRSIAPQGAAAVLHLAGDAQLLAGLLAPGGRIASTLGFGPDQLGHRDATAITVWANPVAGTLDRLAADAAAGDLRVPIDRTYTLREVPKAIDDFRAGTLGKLAVTVP